MKQIFQDSGQLSSNWVEIIRLYMEMMDEVMPYLSLVEQALY